MNYIIMTGNTVSVCLLVLLSNSSDNYLQLSKSILCFYYLLTLYLILFWCVHFSLLSQSTLMTSTPHLEAAGVEGHRPESSRCLEEWPLFSSSWLPFTSRLANSAVTLHPKPNPDCWSRDGLSYLCWVIYTAEQRFCFCAPCQCSLWCLGGFMWYADCTGASWSLKGSHVADGHHFSSIRKWQLYANQNRHPWQPSLS